MTMKCDFCNQEFPAEELETKTGALHDSGDPEEFHVCETCAAWIDENTGRKIELLQKMQKLNNRMVVCSKNENY